jgi:hypothetical protein
MKKVPLLPAHAPPEGQWQSPHQTQFRSKARAWKLGINASCSVNLDDRHAKLQGDP